MSDSLFPPFLKWGNYKSKDKNKSDKILVRVKELETFETEFSINVEAELFEEGKWNEIAIPLKSHNSKNNSLLTQWTRLVNEGKIKTGEKMVIKTYLDKSKNGWPIRRFSLEKPS